MKPGPEAGEPAPPHRPNRPLTACGSDEIATFRCQRFHEIDLPTRRGDAETVRSAVGQVCEAMQNRRETASNCNAYFASTMNVGTIPETVENPELPADSHVEQPCTLPRYACG